MALLHTCHTSASGHTWPVMFYRHRAEFIRTALTRLTQNQERSFHVHNAGKMWPTYSIYTYILYIFHLTVLLVHMTKPDSHCEPISQLLATLV